MKRPRWFVRGDSDGFVGLFIDNLLQLLLIAVLCPAVCGLPQQLIITRILPAAALSILFGNFFYSWQAWRLARKTGRDDVTAMPYGINTVSLIAFIFFIMGPLWRETRDANLVWQAGVFACFLSGVIELAGAFLVDPIRRFLPRAALLSSLAGVAVAFISMGFAFQIFAHPAIALTPMLLILLAYATRARFPLGLPAGLVAIAVGAATAWILRWAGISGFPTAAEAAAPGFHLPSPDLEGFLAFLGDPRGWRYFSIILPMGLFTVMGSLQALDSAEAAGDRFETRPSLAANGVGSLLAALLGSPFPTTIYIGHVGWKSMGARIGYSALNGMVIAAMCMAGVVTLVLRVVPLEATLGILIWIGVVMTAQAFQETPKEHAPAVAIGLIPALGAWALFLVETAVAATGSNLEASIPKFGTGLYIEGVIALNQGFLLSSMLLSGMAAFAIDRRFRAAAVCAFAAALLSAVGLIHAWRFQDGSVTSKLEWMAAPAFAVSYAAVGGMLLLVGWLARKGEGRGAG